MRILFDSQIFCQQVYGGVSRYICCLASRLDNFPKADIRISAPLFINEYLSRVNKRLIKGYKFRQPPNGTRKIFRITNYLLSIIDIKNFQPDIIHETYYSSLSYATKNSKKVITVHDMIFEMFPDMSSQSSRALKFKRKSIQRSDHIICISNSTRNDLMDYYSVPSNKISVIYHGIDKLTSSPVSLKNKMLIKNHKPYLLYVGERKGYKNFSHFLYAFAGSLWLKENFKIVLFGGGMLDKEELHLLNKLRISPDRFLHISGGDSKLRLCYQNASALIYPSIYEGFGLPILEAMYYKCPVICSNTSSIPEVAGNAAEYFNPHDVLSIRSAIEKVLNSIERRSQLIKLGIEQSAKYTWQKCAEKTFAVYRGLMNKN